MRGHYMKRILKILGIGCSMLGLALSLTACSPSRSGSGAMGGPGGMGGGVGAAGSVIRGSLQDFTLNAGDRVFFQLNSSVLDATAQQTLRLQAQWLERYPNYRILIEGHSDERGTRQYNIALGARRAVAARDYLIAQGVSSTRIETISYGKERPVALCNAASCWSQNRRSVTVLKQ